MSYCTQFQTFKKQFLKISYDFLQDTNNDIDNTTAYIAYNDQPPLGPTTDTNGHTKGVLLTTATGGIFLQHSVPHFPLLDKQNLRYSYPHTGLNNGQILHCLSLDIDQIDNIGNILEVTKPHVYNYSIPDAISTSLPTLEKFLKNTRKNGPDVNHKIIQIQNAGRIIQSFAKGPSFHEGLSSFFVLFNLHSLSTVMSCITIRLYS